LRDFYANDSHIKRNVLRKRKERKKEEEKEKKKEREREIKEEKIKQLKTHGILGNKEKNGIE